MAGVRVLAGYRVFKDNGDVATDATATFYLAGTTTLQEVFSDKDLGSSLGSSVSASATGVFPDIFVSDALSIKVIIAATGYTSDTIDYLTVATSGALNFAGTIYPTSSDGGALGTSSNMWSDLFLASGGVINWNAGDVTITHAANVLTFANASTGYKFDAAILPNASDGAALGSASLMFSDLFLASGGVLNFNAGDVTVTHSANTLAFAGASSGYTFDAAPLPSANDGAALGASGTAWSDLFLASGAVVNFAAGDVTITHSSNALAFAGASSGYSFDAGATFAGNITPLASDGAALGTASLMFSDLFLASGAVVNFNNGDVTITHSANTLAFAGASSGYTFDAGVASPSLVVTGQTGALDAATVKNRHIRCSGNITLPASGMNDGDWILIDPGGSARTITRPGAHTMYVNNTDAATGTTGARNTVTAIFHGSSSYSLIGNVS